MRYVDCTYLEIATHASNGWLALIPMGCTEQQGPHLGVGFDTWFAEELLLAASERAAADHQIGCLVLPPLPYGPTPEHRGFRTGYVDLPVALHDAVCDAVLESLAEQGFSRLVVWRGCGGHDLRARIGHFNQRWRGQARAFLPDPPLHQIWCRVTDSDVAGGHADSFTTSIALHRHPELVRPDRVPGPSHGPVDWDDSGLDFTAYSSSGVIGDPRHGSAERGAALWSECVAWTVGLIRQVAAANSDPPRK
ncbi:MAG: creatininase family protein [Micromonosporaceae bacterium]|nr:creatininase family protein [Micromonosporaceae bacterium]